MGDYEAWYDRGEDACDEDIDCWTRFYHDSMSGALSPETREKIRQGFLDHVLEKVFERFKDIWVDECGLDLRAWYDLLTQLDPDWQDYAKAFFARTLMEEVMPLIEEAKQDPEARANWRPYMEKVLPYALSGYFDRMSQSEIASAAGVSAHSVWNTVWWARKYAGVDLYPGWP